MIVAEGWSSDSPYHCSCYYVFCCNNCCFCAALIPCSGFCVLHFAVPVGKVYYEICLGC